jgi:hypothetical protein
MDAQESRGIELALEVGEGHVEQVLPRRRGRVCTAIAGEDVRDLVDRHQLHAIADAGGEVVEERGGAQLADEVLERLTPVAVLRLIVPARHAIECAIEAGPLHGLEQIIDGVELERLHRMLVVSGDEDHERAPRQPLHDLEATQPRHVDVEKDHVHRFRR